MSYDVISNSDFFYGVGGSVRGQILTHDRRIGCTAEVIGIETSRTFQTYFEDISVSTCYMSRLIILLIWCYRATNICPSCEKLKKKKKLQVYC